MFPPLGNKHSTHLKNTMQMVMAALEANQPHPSAQCCESASPAFTVELHLKLRAPQAPSEVLVLN